MTIHHLPTPTKERILNQKNSFTTPQLDQTQYTVNGILRYEKVFGHNFVSTGGIKTTQELFAEIDLTHGAKVLDIGSGLRSEEHTSELQSLVNLVCRLLLETNRFESKRIRLHYH